MTKRRKKILIGLSLGLCLVIIGVLWARWRPAQRFDSTPREQGQLRVATWNVGYFTIADNKNMRNLEIENVASLLNDLDAQVVLLQELSSSTQAEEIVHLLGDEWTAYSVATGHGAQVLSVLTVLPAIAEEEVLCGGRYTKGLTLGLPTGQSLYVLAVHAPHPARGIAENRLAVNCVIEHVKDRTEPIRVVGGDLNYNFAPDSDDAFYHEIIAYFADGTKGIGETYYAHTRIDHLFHYPKDLKVVNSASGMVDLPWRFADVPGFRDHRPIVVSYQLD